MPMRRPMIATLVLATACLPVWAEEAASSAKAPAAPTATTTAPATSSAPEVRPDTAKKPPSAAEVMDDLTGRIERNPAIEPTHKSPSSIAPLPNLPAGMTEEAGSIVAGVAPGGQMMKMRKEGEFVINRPGRLVRAPQSGILLFAFDSDSPTGVEPPVIIMPCAYLQFMEDTARERGDRVVFVISGQVTSYRGANYLLPTNVRQGIDRGNLSR